jgi:hypothetical protein
VGGKTKYEARNEKSKAISEWENNLAYCLWLAGIYTIALRSCV